MGHKSTPQVSDTNASSPGSFEWTWRKLMNHVEQMGPRMHLPLFWELGVEAAALSWNPGKLRSQRQCVQSFGVHVCHATSWMDA